MSKKTSKVDALRQMRESNLDSLQKGTLAYHTAEVKKHFSQMRTSALAAAHELKIIRDQKLYRETHHTFAEFVEAEFGIKKSQAYRLIDGAEISISLSPRGDILPTNEKQVRPLAKLPEEQRQAAWDHAVDRSGGEAPSHRTVQAVVKDMRDDPIEDDDSDDMEVDVIEEWERTQKQLEDAQKVIRSQRADDTAAEIEKLYLQIAALQSRIQQLTETAKQEQNNAKFQHKHLTAIRKHFGVIDYSEILPEAKRRDDVLKAARELLGVQTDDEILGAISHLIEG